MLHYQTPSHHTTTHHERVAAPTVPVRVTARSSTRGVDARERGEALTRKRAVGATLVADTAPLGTVRPLKGEPAMAKRIILPGLSRSTKCSTRACHRLDGHKGEHRGTLMATKSQSIAVATSIVEQGTEVRSADVYTVQEDVPAKARKARRPKVVTLPMAEYKRLVAASGKTVKTVRYHVSGKPSARLA